MARTCSISSIDAEISKLEDELSKVQEKYDALAARILELQKQKQEPPLLNRLHDMLDCYLKYDKEL